MIALFCRSEPKKFCHLLNLLIVSNIEYEKIPDEEQWKVEFLREIMSVRNGELEFQDNQFEMKEIQILVNYISSM